MITYDYILETKLNEKESLKFSPNALLNNIPNMVFIEGPNSIGKSTLLNILALGFYGLKNKRINPLLRNKIKTLIDDNQKLTFDLTITSKNETLKIQKKDSASDDIILKQIINGNERLLSYETFEKKYNLIYDIPNNPTERFSDLLKELQVEQDHFGNKVKSFSNYLDTTIRDLSQSQNHKRLSEAKETLAQFQKQQEEINGELPQLENKKNKLEKATNLTWLLHYTKENLSLYDKIQKMIKEQKNYAKEVKKVNIEVTGRQRKVDELQKTLLEMYEGLTPVLPSELSKGDKQRFKNWEDFNPYRADDFDLGAFIIEVSYYKDLFIKEKNKMDKDSNFKNATTLQKILGSLKQFEDSDIEIPELHVDMKKLVEILSQQDQKNTSLNNRYQKISDVIEALTLMENNLLEYRTELKELKKDAELKNQHSGDYDAFFGLKTQIQKAEASMAKTEKQREIYLNRCVSNGCELNQLNVPYDIESLVRNLTSYNFPKDFLKLSEEQMNENISQLNKKINEERSNLPTISVVIQQLKKEIAQLEKLKPHKYEAYQYQINELQRRTQVLASKILQGFNNEISFLIANSFNNNTAITSNQFDAVKSSKQETEQKKRYLTQVNLYLARRIGTFRHINKQYTAKMVDALSKTITTEDGIEIRLGNMGTGQTMSAYLCSLLTVPKSDDRKIIVLFDEIAMMDEISLEPLCAKIKELYNEERLVLAMLVQRSKELNVREL